MKKYLLVMSSSLQNLFAYRMNFFLWRFRIILNILLTYFLWQAVFQSNSNLFGYDSKRMFTYIVMMILVNGIVLSTQTAEMAEDINYGLLSNLLVKPMNYFGYIFSREIADKVVNVVCAIIEFMIFKTFLKPPFYYQTDPLILLFFVIVLILATILYFEIGVILSLIAFWSKETWAPRFIFFILVAFLAGIYFPLDILPTPIYFVLKILPFSYLVFFPLKLYLGEFNLLSTAQGLFFMFFWILFFALFINFFWKKGLKIYTSEGS